MADSEKAAAPAYAPYATFKKKVRSLADASGTVPSHVDKTLLSGMSGSAQTSFLASLRFFGLITADNSSTETLQELATASDEQWRVLFEKHLRAAYTDELPLLASGSPGKLKESFSNKIGTSLIGNAVRFLVTAAQDCGVPVSSHHGTAKPGVASSVARRRRSTRRTPSPASPPRNGSFDPPGTGRATYRDALLAKFPPFDPGWPAEQQAAWFKAYEKLLATSGEVNDE